MTDRELMQQALEALENGRRVRACEGGTKLQPPLEDAAIAALRERLAQPEQEPVAWMFDKAKYREEDLRGRQWQFNCFSKTKPFIDNMVRNVTPLYTTQPPRQWQGLTPREIELLDGMIEVQLYHAAQCDRIANRTIAEKQIGLDMERVALLRKLREKNT